MVLIICTVASSAYGQAPQRDDEAEKKALKLFNEGLQLYDSGRYKEACARLEESLLAFPGTGTRGLLAECYEKRGLLASAYKLYREVERLTRETGDDRTAVARARADALEEKVPRLVVEPGPMATRTGFEVMLNGESVRASSLGIPIFVDPGEHRVSASAPGYLPWNTTIVARADKTVTVRVSRLESDPASQRQPSRLQRQIGWALISVGGVGLIGGSYYGLRAVQKRDELNECKNDAGCQSTPQETMLADDARRVADTSTVFVAVGVTAGALGAYLVWRNWERGSPSAASSGDQARLHLTPYLSAEGAGLGILGRF